MKDDAKAIGRASVVIALTVVVQVAFRAVPPSVSIPAVVAFGLAFAAIAGSVIALALFAPPISPRALVLLVVPLFVLASLSGMGGPNIAGAAAIAASLLAAGTLVGGAIGGRVEHAGHGLVIAYVGSAADVFSVFHERGVTAQIAASPEALNVAAIAWPMLGTSAIEPILGVGDVVMAVIYGAIAHKHGLARGRTAVALGSAFVVVLVALIVFAQPLPVLPFFGVAMLIAHPELRVVPKKDRVAAAVGMVTITLLFVALALWW